MNINDIEKKTGAVFKKTFFEQKSIGKLEHFKINIFLFSEQKKKKKKIIYQIFINSWTSQKLFSHSFLLVCDVCSQFFLLY